MNIIQELFNYRNLIAALTGRQLASRYRGSALGLLWSFLNPLFFMLIYTLVFKYYIRFDHLENYSIYLFCGLLPWTWLISGSIEAASSITSSGHLITKSMFPPQVLPVVSVLANFIHYLFSLILLFFFMLYFKVAFTWALLLLPFVIILQIFLMYGMGLLFSSLNVFYRDVQHLLGNVFNLLFFLCPILYPVSTVPDKFKFTLLLNPFAQLINLYQQIILYGKVPAFKIWIGLFLFSVFVFIIGKRVYLAHRESFAEYL